MDKEVLLYLASQSILDAFSYTKIINEKELKNKYPYLKKEGASFVTLTQKGKLRGCIGSLIAHSPLLDDIVSNAYSAAFKDPRFPKLTREEFAFTDIEISILCEPKEVKYTDLADLKTKITPNKDGVILKLGSNQATFLPQVWEELPDFDSFFNHLFLKANLPSQSFAVHPKIYTYQVEKFK